MENGMEPLSMVQEGTTVSLNHGKGAFGEDSTPSNVEFVSTFMYRAWQQILE